MDYSKFEVEDFLTNEEFVKWVTAPTKDREIFWQKWMENHPAQRNAIYEARKIIRNLEFPSIELAVGEDEAILNHVLLGKYSTLRQEINRPGAGSRRLRYNVLKAAASILLIAVLSYLFIDFVKPEETMVQVVESTIVKSTRMGEKLTVILPDSSIVKLNSASTLSYSSKFLEARNVKLEGEAFFEVTRRDGQSFVVETPHLTTTVLGTSFNVRAFDNGQVESVSLVSGKVSVQSKGDRQASPVLLSPREKLEYRTSTGSLSFVPFRIDEVLWKDGILVFNNASLESFISRIENWYGVEVTVSGHERTDWAIKGTFENKSLEHILEGLKFSENIDYSLNDIEKKVILIM